MTTVWTLQLLTTWRNLVGGALRLHATMPACMISRNLVAGSGWPALRRVGPATRVAGPPRGDCRALLLAARGQLLGLVCLGGRLSERRDGQDRTMGYVKQLLGDAAQKGARHG